MTNIIKVIGVGGCGNNIVNNMFKQGIENVSYTLCNTDSEFLSDTLIPEKIQLGKTGRGAKSIEEGREATNENIAEINGLFNDDTKIVFLVAGMGGNTGAAAVPIIANAAKNKGVLTVGIVTIPFLFEGIEKIKKAINAVGEIERNTDALLVINNEDLKEFYPDLNMLDAFAKVDEVLIDTVKKVIDALSAIDINDDQLLKQTLLDAIDAIDSPLVTKEHYSRTRNRRAQKPDNDTYVTKYDNKQQRKS